MYKVHKEAGHWQDQGLGNFQRPSCVTVQCYGQPRHASAIQSFTKQGACVLHTLLMKLDTMDPSTHHMTGASCLSTRNAPTAADTTHLVCGRHQQPHRQQIHEHRSCACSSYHQL